MRRLQSTARRGGSCLFLGLLLLAAGTGPTVAEGPRPRARDLGVVIGQLPTGRLNAITDVPGVRVGHVTLIRGSGRLRVGEGPVRTGVTAILPHADDIYQNQVYGAFESLNGNGVVTGGDWLNERGLLEVPILLTNTLSVGTVYDGVVAHMLRQDPSRGPLPVVGECWDGQLNDIAGRHVKERHVLDAIGAARGGPVTEGSVGAGTGMRAYQFKAGIGTASRVLDDSSGTYTVGVLVNANCGRRSELVVAGIPVGSMLPVHADPPSRDGSIIVVVATDAPLLPSQIRRLCKRTALGIGRTGTVSRHHSGDFAIAFSTAQRIPRDAAPIDTVRTLRDNRLTPFFQAVVEATEEALLNAMFVADRMVGRDDAVLPGLPVNRVLQILKEHRRLQ
jgi:D-aminopeptidase